MRDKVQEKSTGKQIMQTNYAILLALNLRFKEFLFNLNANCILKGFETLWRVDESWKSVSCVTFDNTMSTFATVH